MCHGFEQRADAGNRQCATRVGGPAPLVPEAARGGATADRNTEMDLEGSMIMPAIDTEAAIYGDCQWFFASERSETNLVPSSYHDRKAIIDRILGFFLLLLAAVPLAMLLAVVR